MGEAARIKQTKHSRSVQLSQSHEGKFAEGLSVRKLFFIFMVGSVLGTLYEDILIYLQSGVWMLHRGVIYGPFNVIYGFGAAVMCWVLLRKKYNNWQIIGISALLGGVMEYLLSWGQELIVGTVSWDYSQQFLSINGRTTIPIMLVWGLMGLVLVKGVYPVLSNLVELIPPRVGEPVFWGLLAFMILNCLISWTAVIRQNLRYHEVPPLTPVGEFYDRYYTDDFLRKYYPNMVRKGE